MKIWENKSRSCEVIFGHVMRGIKQIPDNYVQTVVTSPPYYAQRDYGTGTWEGGDPDCKHDKAKLKSRFDYSMETSGKFQSGIAIPRVGADAPRWKKECPACGAKRVDHQLGSEDTPEEYVERMVKVFRQIRRILRDDGTVWLNLGDKYDSGNLLGIPWRVAFALQADGWVLRQDIIWHKRNGMPSSVENRCTVNHEYIFLLTKSTEYYYDAEAIKEKSVKGPAGSSFTKGKTALHQPGASKKERKDYEDRNKRSVWSVPVASFRGAHFAVFPKRLITPCILAGTSQKGCCPACGAPYQRIVDKERKATRPGTNTKVKGDAKREGKRDPKRHVTKTLTVGWEPGCQCNAGDAVPCVVFDPFTGSGTTAEVSLSRGRHFIGCELGESNLEFIERRVKRAEKKGLFFV